MSGNKVRKSDDTISRNVIANELRVEKGSSSADVSMSGSAVEIKK